MLICIRSKNLGSPTNGGLGSFARVSMLYALIPLFFLYCVFLFISSLSKKGDNDSPQIAACLLLVLICRLSPILFDIHNFNKYDLLLRLRDNNSIFIVFTAWAPQRAPSCSSIVYFLRNARAPQRAPSCSSFFLK